jgi:hypothetical protein
MSADTIVALGTLIAAVSSMLVAVWTLANSARKDEIARLQTRLKCVEDENAVLHQQVLNLRAENMWLRLFLSSKGIEVPPMPNGGVESNAPGAA